MAGKRATRDSAGLEAARRAIDAMGGPAAAARALFDADHHGREQLTPATVSRWARTGIPPAWCPLVHQLTEIPLAELDPVVYPPALVGDRGA